MEEIQRLENRNNFLNNEITRLNTSKPTAEEKEKLKEILKK